MIFDIKQKLKAVIYMSKFFVIYLYLLRLIYPYKPFLDDHIQFNVYSLHPNPINDVFINSGTFATRPAANFLDIALYSYFGDVLYIPYIFYVLLYLAFVLLLRYVLSKTDIETGQIFLTLALLCPLNIEGTVWLSAATRIVPGLFLACASSLLLFGKKTILKSILFWLTNLLSYLFYEQSAVFSVALIFLISYREKRIMPALVSFVNGAAVVAFYYAFKDYGVFCYRMSSLSFPDATYFFSRLWECLHRCFFTFVQEGVLFVLPVTVAFGIYAARSTYSLKKDTFKLIFGISVTLLSFVPIMLTGEYNIPFRCLAVPLIGIALVIDCIRNERAAKLVTICLVSVFVASSFVEFNRLDISLQIDEKLISQIKEVVSENEGKSISIHKVKSYYHESPSNHAEHIAAITSSDWAITGALRAATKNPYLPLLKMDIPSDVNIYLTSDGKQIHYVEYRKNR